MREVRTESSPTADALEGSSGAPAVSPEAPVEGIVRPAVLPQEPAAQEPPVQGEAQVPEPVAALARAEAQTAQEASHLPGAAPAQLSAPLVVARKRHHSRWWHWLVLPIVGALLLGGAAVTVDAMTTPTYTAEALVVVLPTDAAGAVSLPVAGIFLHVGSSGVVMQVAAHELGVTEATLSSSVTLAEAADSPVISIDATTPDAARSARWANTVAAQLLRQAALNPVPFYGLRQVSPALTPQTRSTPVTGLVKLAAAVLGAVLGLAAARRLRRGRRAAPR